MTQTDQQRKRALKWYEYLTEGWLEEASALQAVDKLEEVEHRRQWLRDRAKRTNRVV